MQENADKAADDNQIRVFNEGEHRQDGNENAEKADGVVQKLIAGANGFENGIGDEPCGDAGDGRPNALFRSHATENRRMLVGAFVPLEECDELQRAGKEQRVGGHRHESEIVIDVCVEQGVETADKRCISVDTGLQEADD